MRQTLKARRGQLHSGIPTSRLFTMMLMLAIMGLIFVRLRDPDTWRWFARDDDNQDVVVNETAGSNQPLAIPSQATGQNTTPAHGQGETSPGPHEKTAVSQKSPATTSRPASPAAVPPAPKASEIPRGKDSSAAATELTPTGPTDLDPMEQEDIKEAISIITDGTQEMTNLDMLAYFQILGWVDHQSTALLLKRAKRDVLYSDFRKTPDSMRLQIVDVKLHVLEIIRHTEPPKNGITKPMTTREGNPIYEVRGFTREGGSNLYIGIVVDLPKGMPIGTSLNEDARIVGYFFKLQGYISQAQQLEAEQTRRKPVVLKAPLIMGRLIWTAASSDSEAEEKLPFWLLATIGSVAAAVVVGWVLLNSRSTRRRGLPAMVPNASVDPDAPGVDNWLDQAQSGRMTFLEPVPETPARNDGAALDGGLGHRLSGNILGENGESNNGHGDSAPGVPYDDNPSSG